MLPHPRKLSALEDQPPSPPNRSPRPLKAFDSSECAVVVAPGSGAIGIEVPIVLVVPVVYPVRAPVKVIDCGFVVVVMVAVAIVVAAVIVATVPGGISIEVIVVVNNGATAPVTIPGIPSPSAATAARKCTKSDSSAEPDDAGGRHIARGVSRGDVWVAIDYRRIVFRNVYHLGVRGLDDDGLRRLLHHSDLRC